MSALLAAAPQEPRAVCLRCGRPEAVCYCAHLSSVPTATRIVVLQHPRERRVAIGTGRMATLCLPSAELRVGVDFSADPRFLEALRDPARPAALLYPGPASRELSRGSRLGPLTLIVVDGTWAQARQIVRRTAPLAALPRLRLTPPAPSEYRIRREPRRDYLSTVEALVQALGLLEGEPERFEALLEPFRAMVEAQLAYEGHRRGPSRHRTHWEARPPKVPRVPASLTLRAKDLVCAVAEANAWSARRPGGFPDELVHWLALRVATGERFEAVLAPRHPLAPSTEVHTRLSPAVLASGVTSPQLAGRWRAFLRPEDVLCVWGPFPLELARASGVELPRAWIDLRKVAGDLLQGAPGMMEDYLERHDLPWAPAGMGRGGERLGKLGAIAVHMASVCPSSVPQAQQRGRCREESG
jgi:DTW domain-containing protein YfiP